VWRVGRWEPPKNGRDRRRSGLQAIRHAVRGHPGAGTAPRGAVKRSGSSRRGGSTCHGPGPHGRMGRLGDRVPALLADIRRPRSRTAPARRPSSSPQPSLSAGCPWDRTSRCLLSGRNGSLVRQNSCPVQVRSALRLRGLLSARPPRDRTPIRILTNRFYDIIASRPPQGQSEFRLPSRGGGPLAALPAAGARITIQGGENSRRYAKGARI